MGILSDLVALAACKVAAQAIDVSVNSKSFERGKRGERPFVMGGDAELQEIADKAYKAGQMASIAESAKKFSDK